MTARAYARGHEITFAPGREGQCTDPSAWVYVDTGEPVGDMTRPCARCGRAPTPEGYDACLGHIPGAVAACCGHGVDEPYVMMEDGGD